MKKLTVLAILLPAGALANGYDVPNVNPRDLALSGSAVAAQRDAAAAYANPAALSRVEGVSLSLALAYLDLEARWEGPPASPFPGATASTKFRPVPPVSLFAAYGFKLGERNAGVGFGANVPGGGNVYWQNDWEGRGRIITVNRKVYGLYLTGGYEIIPQVRVGGGLVYYYTAEYLKQGIQPSTESFGELSTRGGGFAFDVAAEIKPISSVPLTFGVDYKYRGRMVLEGDGRFVVPGGFLQPDPLDPSAAPPVDQNVRHVLTFPDVLHLGVAYRVIEPLQLTFDYTWNNYSVYQNDVFEGDRGTTITVQRSYDDGHTFRFGAEYDLLPRLQVRAGFLRDLSGLDANRYSPTLPDGNVWAASFGAGYTLRSDLTLNGALFYTWFDKVRQLSDQELMGIYDTRVYIVSLGFTWRTDLGGR